MIIASHLAPRSVLAQAVLGSIEKYLPASNEHGLVLLPILTTGASIYKGILQADSFSISLDYRVQQIHDLTCWETFAVNSDDGLGRTPGNIRIPYIVFVHSNEFRREHRHALEQGHSAYALIQRLTRTR